MNLSRGGLSILGFWAVAVVFMGSIFTSYHQPFRSPAESVLALVQDPGRGKWRMLHVLSTNCGCSQRVMKHLLQRHRISNVTEQVLLVDGDDTASPGVDQMVARLAEQGFPVTHIAAKHIPRQTGLHGVPLLIVASPENKIAYMGGYGIRGDGDSSVLESTRAGKLIAALPVLGCAVGSQIRRQADPFGFKYQ